MSSIIWKNEAGRQRLEAFYDRFKAKIPAEISERKVPTRFGETNVLVAGPNDAPPIICLHAMRTGAPFLLSELGPLANDFRLFAPELPGQSIRGIHRKLRLDDRSYADWTEDVMDSLGLSEANLFGVSWGAYVAVLTAIAFPDRVSRLAVMVPAGIANGSHLTGLLQMAIPFARYKMRPNEANLKALLSPVLTTWDSDWAEFFACSLRDWRMDSRIPPLFPDDDLARLEMPVLVIGADQDISFPGERVIARVDQLIPHAETDLLKDCKHCPPTDAEFRDWLASRLTRFMDNGGVPLGQQA